MNFSEYKNIEDFKKKTGMDSVESFDFLSNELSKMAEECLKLIDAELERIRRRNI